MESPSNALKVMILKYPKMQVHYKDTEGLVKAFSRTLQNANSVPRGLLRMQLHLARAFKVDPVDARIISQCTLHVYTMRVQGEGQSSGETDGAAAEIGNEN